MSSFECAHGEHYALFGEGGGRSLAEQIGAPLLGTVPIEPAVAAGGDTGRPVAIDGVGRAADAFREIAARVVTDVAPPIRMDGCSARVVDTPVTIRRA